MKKALIGITIATLVGCSADKPVTPQEIETLLQAGEYSRAILELRESIANNNNDIELRKLLAKSYLYQGSYLFAEKEVFYVLDNSETPPLNFVETAFEALLLTENFTAIDKYTKQFSAKLSSRASLLSFLAGVNPGYKPSGEYKQIVDALLEGNSENLSDLAGSLSVNQENYAFLYVITQHLFSSGQYAKAYSIAEKIVSVRPQDEKTLFYAMLSSYKSGLLDESAVYAKTIDSMDKDNAIATLVFAAKKLKDGDFSQAKIFSDKALAAGLISPDIRLISGITNYQLGYYEQAYNQFEKVKPLLPESHPARKYILATELELGNLASATSELETLDITDETAMLVMQLGEKLKLNQQSTKADEVLNQLSNAELTDINAQFYIDSFLSSQGVKSEEAMTESFYASDKSSGQRSLYISALLSAGSTEKALNEVEKWLKVEPNSISDLLLKAAVELNQKQISNAEETLNRILSIDSKHLPSRLYFANKLVQEGNFEKAIDDFHSIAEDAFYSRQATAGLITAANKSNTLKKEVDWLDNLYKSKNGITNKFATFDMAFLLASIGKVDASKTLLTKWRSQNTSPDDLNSYYVVLSAIVASNNSPEEAEDLIARWKSDTGYTNALVRFSLKFYEQQAEWRKGLDFINDALQSTMAKQSPQLPLMEAYFLVRVGELNAATTKLNLLKEANSENYYWKKAYAMLQAFKGKNKEAQVLLSSLYDSNPSTENAVLLMRTSIALQDDNAVKSIATKHLDAYPNDTNVALRYAEWLLVKSPEDSLELYKELINQGVKSATVYNNTAWLLGQNKKTQEALDFAQKARELSPDEPGIIDTIADLYLKSNLNDKALNTVAEFYQNHQDNFGAGVLYANTLIAIGEKAQAKIIVGKLKPINRKQTEQLEMLKRKVM